MKTCVSIRLLGSVALAVCSILPLHAYADGEAEPLMLSDDIYFAGDSAQQPSEEGKQSKDDSKRGNSTDGAIVQSAKKEPRQPKKRPERGASAKKVTIATASEERLAVAAGHYARARAMLIAAVREFDRGMKHADASPLLDVAAWRNSLIGKAQELQRVLDPQPRTSRTGVRFEGDPRLLGEAPQ